MKTKSMVTVISASIFLMLLVMIPMVGTNAHNGRPWYYSYTDVDKLYEKHYNRESRLENAVYFKDGAFFANIEAGGEWMTLEIPCFLLANIMLHLRDGLEKEWFRYIFWPDLNHGHPFLPTKTKGKYAKLGWKNYYKLSMSDKKLGILYHAAEHFCNTDPASTGFIKTRNIIGWFDGKPIELTGPGPDDNEKAHEANSAGVPEGHDSVWPMYVSASKNGLFRIFDRVHNKFVRLDLSFTVASVYDSTTEEERALEGRETPGTGPELP